MTRSQHFFHFPDMLINDRTFFVTGGASGLGLAVVEELLQHGANVVIIDLKEKPLDLKVLTNTNRVLYVIADVTSEEGIKEAIKAGVNKFGNTIGGLVNSGGIGSVDMTVASNGKPADLETFKSVVDVNLVGTFNVSRLVASEMIRQMPDEDGERGVIIHLSSIASEDGEMGQAAYSASKGGITGMTLPMARDLARFGIRVLSVAPGACETPMASRLPEKAVQFIIRKIGFPKRLGKPKEVASLIIHMIQNSYMNATQVRIDGGARL
ncbi:1257_t:CDS:2 [Paraglomus brasilianum]|uniref:1257_t:CDS:1 n=1 Tax=Paraglomus brasilianum TaxID=144538 RepID=A0A9N8VU64_9GLOM|nr:1257_t:CDS:2 [Paraglomus brasilianum]